MPPSPDKRMPLAGRMGSMAGPAALAFAGAMLLVLWARVPDLALDHDEVEHLHAAWLVSQGDLPYRDFGENHNPVLWYALAPLLPATDSPRDAVRAGRAAMAACSLLSLVLAALLARRIGGPRAMLLAPLLLVVSTYWSVYSVQIRPDVPMTTLVLLGLVLGLPRRGKWCQPPFSEKRRLAPFPAPFPLLAGLAIGAAAAVLLKAAVVGATLFAGIVLQAVLTRNMRRQSLLAALALAVGFTIPLAALALMLQGAGILDGFWLWVVRLQGPYLMGQDGNGFAMGEVLRASFQRDTLAWAGLALALVRFAMAPALDRAILLAIVAVVLGGTAATRLPNYQYLVPAITLMAVLGADALVAIGERFSTTPRRQAAAVAMLVATVVTFGARHALTVASLPDDEAQVARMQQVLALTSPDDTVIASPPDHPIFRRDALHLWFNNPDFHRALTSLAPSPPYDRYMGDPQRLQEHPPAVIVKAGSRWHPFYGIGTLAGRRFEAADDPEVLVRLR
jgi:hypothetical protein